MSDQLTPITLHLHARMKIKNARIFKGDDNQYYGFFKNRFGLWELAINKNVQKLLHAQLMSPSEWPLLIIKKGELPASDTFMRTVIHTYGLEFEKKPAEVELDAGAEEVNAYLIAVDEVKNHAYYYTTHIKWDFICFVTDPFGKYGMRAIETNDAFTTLGRTIPESVWEDWIIDVPKENDAQTKIGRQLKNILTTEG